jgi:hypothetical protein
MAWGSPFYTRERTFQNDVYPPAIDADAGNDWEAAHQEASDRVVGIEAAVDLRPDSLDIDHMRVMTQGAYDALGTKDPRTLYIISG